MRGVFINAEVLGPQGWEVRDLALDGTQIASEVDAKRYDLSGFRLLPGIVDLHGDGFERHLAPRRGAVQDRGAGLAATQAELGANGITTAVLAQFFSWEGGMRSPDFAESMAAALSMFPSLLDLRLQLRLETHLTESYARAEALIERHNVGYLVLNDHLPHTALAKGRRPPRLTGQALKSGRSPEAHLALLTELAARDVSAEVAALVARLTLKGVLVGSHDDTSPQIRATYREMGAKLAEFPETIETAQAAKAAGDPVILGAPNVLRGGSHAGKLRAADLVDADLCDALVSDYHYPAMIGAVQRLVADGVCDWAAAWQLVSARPAEVLRLADRGTLAPGNRADIIAVEAATGRTCLTLAAGQIAHLTDPLAGRLIAAK
jgi:alpha-D-ribose 1-methylphosphonate 5-triphosphate diphosphatase